MSQQILIVEDEEKIAGLMKDYLTTAGFDTAHVSRGDEVVQTVRRKMPALILLDIMLPGKDGVEVCREIRQFSQVPIIFLTAKVEEIDRLLGLELGADDYICKPFSFREVIARIRAVLRRAALQEAGVDEKLLVEGPVTLDVPAHQAFVDGQTLDLTPSEFGLLKVLMSQPGRVFKRTELVERVQGYSFEGYDRTIDTHIKNLRKKISQKCSGSELVVTVYGVGYKFQTPEDDM